MKRRKFRQIFAFMLTLALCCGMMAGCGGQNYQPTDALYINSPAATYMLYEAAGWKKAHDDVKITAETGGRDWTNFRRWVPGMYDDQALEQQLQAYYDETQMAIMKGTAGDMIELADYYWDYSVKPLDYIKMAKAGAFVDLYPLLEQEGFDMSGWHKEVYDSLAIDGKLYFRAGGSRMMVYTTTRQLMEKYDFPFDANDDIITFLRKCVQWKQAHPDGPDAISSNYWTMLYRYWYDICGYGVVDFKKETVSIDTDEVKELLAMLKELKPENYNSNLYDIEQNELAENRLKFYREESCLFSEIWPSDVETLSAGDEIMALPVRRADGKTIAYTDRYFVAIPSTAENIYNAGSLLAYRIGVDMEEQAKNPNDTWIFLDKQWDQTHFEKLYSSYSVTDAYQQQMLSCYENLGVYLTPQSWNYTLDNYMQDYYADKITVDELTRVLQEKMEIYITE